MVSGESHYGATIFQLTGAPRDGGYQVPWWFLVIREPHNEYDANAIAVHALNGEPDETDVLGQVGYINRDLAAVLALGMDAHAEASGQQGAAFTCAGVLVGGSLDAPNVGVYLHMNQPAIVEEFGLPGGLLDMFSVPVG